MLKHELIHLILSLLAGTLVYKYYKSYFAFLFALIFGVLLDADHLIDYFIYKHSLQFSWKEFLSGIQFKTNDKIFVLFHGYEYALILLLLGILVVLGKRYTKQTKTIFASIFFASALALSFHLLFDTIEYRPKWQAYFVTYRIYYNFRIEKLGFGNQV